MYNLPYLKRNQPAYFTVMGSFRSKHQAKAVAEQLRDFQHEVQQSADDNKWVGDRNLAEYEFGEKHHIDWGEHRGSGWLLGDYPIDELVQVVHKDVLWMSNSGEHRYTATPFRTILTRFGARKCVSQSYYRNTIQFILTYETPNEDVMQSILSILKEYQLYVFKTHHPKDYDIDSLEKPNEAWKPADVPILPTDLYERNYFYELKSLRSIHHKENKNDFPHTVFPCWVWIACVCQLVKVTGMQ